MPTSVVQLQLSADACIAPEALLALTGDMSLQRMTCVDEDQQALQLPLWLSGTSAEHQRLSRSSHTPLMSVLPVLLRLVVCSLEG
jgi:hypothetical protein